MFFNFYCRGRRYIVYILSTCALLVLRLEFVFRIGKLDIRLLCALLSLFLRMFRMCCCFAGVLDVNIRCVACSPAVYCCYRVPSVAVSVRFMHMLLSGHIWLAWNFTFLLYSFKSGVSSVLYFSLSCFVSCDHGSSRVSDILVVLCVECFLQLLVFF